MVAGQIAQLPVDSRVLELGAGSSDLENVVKKNFKRDDIKFTRVDGDKRYESDKTITVFDITSKEFNTRMHAKLAYDCVVFMEVIEHLDKDFAANLSMIASKLRGAFPESYVRATIACLSPAQANRQVLMICKKRRIANGRFTQTR